MPKVPEPWELAKEFCRVLNNWLTPEQITAANMLNAEDANKNVCHSHDFCDANEAMRRACLNWEDPLTTGVPDTDNALMSEAWHNCWEAAWTLAKDAGFNADHVRMEMDGLKRYDAVVAYSSGAETYTDWFAHDKAAEEGYELLLAMQGYKASVVIGFPCVVTIE